MVQLHERWRVAFCWRHTFLSDCEVGIVLAMGYAHIWDNAVMRLVSTKCHFCAGHNTWPYVDIVLSMSIIQSALFLFKLCSTYNCAAIASAGDTCSSPCIWLCCLLASSLMTIGTACDC